MEEGDENSKLSKALAQVEELQKELTLEREQRAAKEASLTEEIDQLQETEVAKENKGMCCTWCSVNGLCLLKGNQHCAGMYLKG